MRQFRPFAGFALTLTLSVTVLQPSFAQYILPGTGSTQATSGITVVKPAGTSTQNVARTGASGSGYVDDVFLSGITFGATTFSSGGGQFRAVGNVNVVAGAANVNAEYGDFDTGTDGNPNPFVLGGVTATTPESTDPAIQRPSIRAAFNSLSLVQGIDGEGTPYTLDLIFQRGINDNNTALDTTPELIFFERGANSTYNIQVITGGTFAAPTFAPNTISINSGNVTQARQTGYFIDTVEITGSQQLAATGLDLNSFFNGAVSTVYGVRVTDVNGADLYGNFLSAVNTNQFVPVPQELQGAGFLSETLVFQPVPAPPAVVSLLIGGGVGLLGMLTRRRRKCEPKK
ncbi:MAG: hypothetical protein H7145_08570 [Akkermansiaceae bacterium]|nr:hypothetical protein [Armatimonadota bacterium]